MQEREQQALETSVSTQGEFAMATASTTMPTPDHTYSTTVTYSKPAPVRIYSTIATTSVPPKPVPNSDAMRDLLRYALDMDAGPVSCPQHATVQTTISVKSPISSSVMTLLQRSMSIWTWRIWNSYRRNWENARENWGAH